MTNQRTLVTAVVQDKAAALGYKTDSSDYPSGGGALYAYFPPGTLFKFSRVYDPCTESSFSIVTDFVVPR